MTNRELAYKIIDLARNLDPYGFASDCDDIDREIERLESDPMSCLDWFSEVLDEDAYDDADRNRVTDAIAHIIANA